MMRNALIGLSALVLSLAAAPGQAADDPYRPKTDWLGGRATPPAYSAMGLRRAAPVPTNMKPLVILMEFSDKNGKGTADYFKDMLFGRHPADDTKLASFPYQNVSMADLYASMSGETFSFETPTVIDWSFAPKPYTYYTEYSGSLPGRGCYGLGESSNGMNAGAPALVIEALKSAEAHGVDLEALDGAGCPAPTATCDHDVKGIFVVHAGAGAEQTSDTFACQKDGTGYTTQGGDIWSHQYTVSYTPQGASQDYTFHYLIGPAESDDSHSTNGLSPMGVWAHEFGHMLDLPDLYAPDQSNGYGVGCWDLMGYGIRSCSTVFSGNDPGEDPNEMSVWTRSQLAWAAPRAVSENVCNRDVDPMQYGGETFKVTPDAQKPGDYFLIEYRATVGRDADLLSFSSDENTNRVCVWHVDDFVAGNQNPNTSSCDPLGDRSLCKANHYGIMLVEYDGNYSLSKGAAYVEAADCIPPGQMLSMADREDLKTWSGTGAAWSVAAGALNTRGRLSISVDPNTPAVAPKIVGSPGEAVRGDLWRYTPKVETASGLAQWRLVTYPKGMTIDTDTGKISWRVPSGYGASKVKVVVAVSNCGGDDDQTFNLAVTDAEAAGCGCRTAGGPSMLDVLPFLGMYVLLRASRRRVREVRFAARRRSHRE